MLKVVNVAVGVIVQAISSANEEPMFFLTQRHEHVHQANKWEFPGGKIEQSETVGQALARELKEEVAIDVLSCEHLMTINHDYGDKHVCLEVYLIDNYEGKPKALEGQKEGWFALSELATIDFPKANYPIVEQLESRFQ
ncbi:8-oxo-dGTP diphosphatase MutT [Litorilituus lipolyticus]|uniref:8-oxo-dGTP diphosphatase n=1 Tax=Litorilituus lipolyticus TaxID=2491017 RepID=A0A502KPC9_9GAMM|nr:8-oxo-dGTP diphosphatase MutT [Litorilituus lipolyticus]TPH12045.1 8-oxo-dGTP diphosphatase MutT [Litorilituus lipolyticus]